MTDPGLRSRSRRDTRARRPAKKLTTAKAAQLVRAIVAVTECDDCPASLRGALEDARAGISPWYDR